MPFLPLCIIHICKHLSGVLFARVEFHRIFLSCAFLNQITSQAIERVALPGSSEVYTVVNKSAVGVRGKPHVPPPGRSGQNGKPLAVADPPYVNQSSIPPKEKPIMYRRSLNKVR